MPFSAHSRLLPVQSNVNSNRISTCFIGCRISYLLTHFEILFICVHEELVEITKTTSFTFVVILQLSKVTIFTLPSNTCYVL